jgi:hypothetical protein
VSGGIFLRGEDDDIHDIMELTGAEIPANPKHCPSPNYLVRLNEELYGGS